MTKKMRIRTLLIGGLFTLLFFGLIYRCYDLQIVNASWLLEDARQRWETDRVLMPKRGTMMDRNGKILAEDAPSYTVAVNPALIHSKQLTEEVVEGLAPVLNMTSPDQKKKLRKLVTKKKDDAQFMQHVEIRNEGWKIDASTAEQIRNLIKEQSLKGIYLVEEQKRYYPANQLAAHVIGYTNKDGDPVLGLEYQYDDILKGIPGSITYEKDSLGYALPDARITYKPALDGKSIRLTIDQNIQHYIEQAMEKTYEKYQPKSMMAIAVDPITLEILGLANFPTFNPNHYWEVADQSSFTNHAVSSTYEPGSTFKIVTLAGAVEEGLFHPDETYQSGTIRVGGRTIGDHNWGRGWGKITFMEGLKRSSNVAFVKLGFEGLGAKKLREYIDKFGFGLKTGVDLPGERQGIIDFRYDSEVATATFGQGRVTVTAMQQIAAVAAVANGGKLMQPYLVKEIIDTESGKVIQKNKPKVIREVLSPETANQVSGYLEQVVSDREIGTGRKAYIEGYRVAAKTGTAQKVVDGRYSDEKYVVSFIGYAPAENPRILVCIIVDEPELNHDYRGGGDVTSPMFKEIVTQSLRYMGVQTNQQSIVKISDKETQRKVPSIVDLNVNEAAAELKRKGIVYQVLGNGDGVVKQYPASGEQIGQGQQVYILTQEKEHIKIPDLSDKSLRDAMEICSLLQIQCHVSGEGFVVDQQLAGSGVNRTLTLKLSPLGASDPEEASAEESADRKDTGKEVDSDPSDDIQSDGSVG